MKKFYLCLLLLICTVNSLKAQSDAPLILISQGEEEFSRYNPRTEQILLMREEMESLIRMGSYPIVLECNKNVAWIFLNDSLNGTDFPAATFKSDYFDFLDLFAIKLTKKLRKAQKMGNKELLQTLGIEYIVKGGEVFSQIDYEKFGKFAF